jgi:hypothetical protein
MPSVPEVDLAEFAETAAALSPQIDNFFKNSGGVGRAKIGACGPIGLQRLRAYACPPRP